MVHKSKIIIIIEKKKKKLAVLLPRKINVYLISYGFLFFGLTNLHSLEKQVFFFDKSLEKRVSLAINFRNHIFKKNN